LDFLGFALFYSSESRLFDGLHAKKNKKIDLRLRLYTKHLTTPYPSPTHSASP
jgi:hypothetical protein